MFLQNIVLKGFTKRVKDIHGKQMVPCPEFKFVGRQYNMLKYHMQWTHFKGSLQPKFFILRKCKTTSVQSSSGLKM
jgi:hypothetical protein